MAEISIKPVRTSHLDPSLVKPVALAAADTMKIPNPGGSTVLVVNVKKAGSLFIQPMGQQQGINFAQHEFKFEDQHIGLNHLGPFDPATFNDGNNLLTITAGADDTFDVGAIRFK